jgi:outer membrane protein OmpA-like peptidoglycan-associated protein
MRSSLVIASILVAGGCGPNNTPLCKPVASWETPLYRCAPAPVQVVEAPKPEPEPPKPEPPPPPPPKVEVKAEKIELGETVQFEVDSANLVENSKSLLNEVADAMKQHPEVTKVQIEGHTDSTASHRHNQKLSEQRAAAVKAYLVSKGVDASRMTTKGFGQDKPVADNKTEEGRFKNRRVDFVIIGGKP